jgi:hypothetical protein
VDMRGEWQGDVKEMLTLPFVPAKAGT